MSSCTSSLLFWPTTRIQTKHQKCACTSMVTRQPTRNQARDARASPESSPPYNQRHHAKGGPLRPTTLYLNTTARMRMRTPRGLKSLPHEAQENPPAQHEAMETAGPLSTPSAAGLPLSRLRNSETLREKEGRHSAYDVGDVGAGQFPPPGTPKPSTSNTTPYPLWGGPARTFAEKRNNLKRRALGTLNLQNLPHKNCSFNLPAYANSPYNALRLQHPSILKTKTKKSSNMLQPCKHL